MFGLLSFAAMAAAIDPQACRDLVDVQLDDTRITAAEVVEAGPFEAPAPFPGAEPEPVELPAHCRVTLLMTPSDESRINAELWLPMADWNGKFLAVGNGGWAGSIQGYPDMQEALKRGYATAASDNGSGGEGANGMFALGSPERLVDFAYRSIHDMTAHSKELVSRFYSEPADLSYYKGCSTGGRQGLMAAQRYPADFDGIIAGAPANRHIHMHVAQSWEMMRVSHNPEAAIPPQTAEMINAAVLDKCDVHDEGFISNPQQCSFDFSTLQCPTGESGEQCLTPEQLETVEIYYSGVRTSDGEEVFAGRALSVPMQPMMPSDEAPTSFLFDTIRILGFQDPDYDWRAFDLDEDLPMIDERVGFIDATDPDLSDFEARGGKLLMYHGWEDPGITPQNAIDYYISVLQEMGADQDDWMQLYMVPGMGHCRGGPGPDEFDTLSTLEDWREDGEVPQRMMGRNAEFGLERPLCPYPEAAVYDGSGDLDSAENWACEAP